METETLSPVLKDIENMGAQNPSRIFIPAADPKKSTHKLVVKEPQPNFGSDDYDCGTRDLHLFSGENALRLDRGAPSSSVLADPQEESNTIVPVIIVSQGPFAIKDDQFLYIDLVGDTDLVTIKDFREFVAPLPDTSQGQGGATDDQENHRVLVEIATASSPSRYEELPRRELRVLLPGDRVRLSSRSTSPFLVLEYIFNRVPGPSNAAEDPSPGTSRNPLTQPQEQGRRETQIDIGSPPRIRVDLINYGLLPQPQEDDHALVEGDQSSDEEVMEGMAEPDGLPHVQHTPSTDHPMYPPINEEEERKDSSMQWKRYLNEKGPGVPDEDTPFERAGQLNSTPRAPQPGNKDGDDNPLSWTRAPGISGGPDNEDYAIYDRPGDVRSVPRDGMPRDVDAPELTWGRPVDEKTPGVDDDEDEPFDRPGALNSIPRDRPGEDTDETGQTWNRSKPRAPGDAGSGVTDIFDRPGDFRSIPRDGKPKDEDHSELLWQGPPHAKIHGVPFEDDVFDRPGDVSSIPRDGRPNDEGHPELSWQRPPGGMIAGLPDEDDVFDRPGDVSSVPRDGRPKDDDHPEMSWQRGPSGNIAGLPDEDDVFDRPADVGSEESFREQGIGGIGLHFDSGIVTDENLNDMELQVEEENDTTLQGSKYALCDGTVGADPRLAMVEAQPDKRKQEGQRIVEMAATSEVVFASTDRKHQEGHIPDPSLTNIASPRDSNMLSTSPLARRSRRNRTKEWEIASVKAKKLMAPDKRKVEETLNNKRKLAELESRMTPASTTQHSTRTLRRRTEKTDPPYRIMATQIENPAQAKQWVENLGGSFHEDVADASEATHLVIGTKDGAPNLVRSPKLMIGIARACHIVHSQFLEKSIKGNEFQKEESFYLHNMKQKNVVKTLEAFNKKFKCNLKDSMVSARELNDGGRQLLSGMQVYLCEGVSGQRDSNNNLSTPVANDFRAILGGAGAEVINELPTPFPEGKTTLVITSTDEEKRAHETSARKVKQALKNDNVKAMTVQDLFDSITRQKWPESVL